MIHKIIDWYNDYTLEDRLELEWLLDTAKRLAIGEMNNTDTKELEYRGCAFSVFTGKNKKIKNNKDKDLLNGDYCIEVKALVVNTKNMDHTTNDTKRQIILMKRKGSTVRVRINIDTISGNRFQFCKEYNIEDINK